MSKSSSFVDSLRMAGRPMSYYPKLGQLLGDLKTGVFICLFIHWDGKGEDPDGWIYKTQKEINEETGLSRYEQETARKTLVELEVLETSRRGQPARLYYKFNWEALEKALFAAQNKTKESVVKKKKAPAVAAEEKPDPLLFRMKEAFDVWYKEIAKTDYIWSKGKGGGKDWKGLKDLSLMIQERLKNLIPAPPITDDLVVEKYRAFLSKLPKWHVEHTTEPAFQASRFNAIFAELATAKKGSSVPVTTELKEFKAA